MNRLAESEAFRKRQERRAIANGTHPAIVARKAVREQVQATEYISHLREQVVGWVGQFPLATEEAIRLLSAPFSTSDGTIPELLPFYLREFIKNEFQRNHSDNRKTIPSEEEYIYLGLIGYALRVVLPDPSRPAKAGRAFSRARERVQRYSEEGMVASPERT